MSITSVVLVDLLGLQVLISSFGLTLLFQGSAAIIGPPITGSTLTTLAMEMCDSVSPEGRVAMDLVWSKLCLCRDRSRAERVSCLPGAREGSFCRTRFLGSHRQSHL